MTFEELKEISESNYYCLSLDKYFPKILRSILRRGSILAALISFILSFNDMPLYFGFTDGLFFLFIFIFLTLFFLELFYRSMKNENEKRFWSRENLGDILSKYDRMPE